jgi:hypothetical protein
VANPEWCSMWNDVGVDVLACYTSNHHPLLVSLKKKKSTSGRRYRQFRYEVGWLKDKEFPKVVQDSWKGGRTWGDPWSVFKNKLNGCRRVIKQWVKKKIQPTERLIMEKTKELEIIQLNADANSVHVGKAIKEELQTLLEKEELKWRQRAKEDWLQEGDRNTKFFHACANQRRSRNNIETIIDDVGCPCASQTAVEEAFINYYQKLFTSENP